MRTRSLLSVTTLLFLAGLQSVHAQGARSASPDALHLEIGGGLGYGGPADPTIGRRSASGSAIVGSVQFRLIGRLSAGVEGLAWRASQGAERSHSNYVLASLRALLPLGTPVYIMAGVGATDSQFGTFQRAASANGTVRRSAIGLGIGIEPVSLGHISLGATARQFNSIGGPRRPDAIYGRLGNSTMLVGALTVSLH